MDTSVTIIKKLFIADWYKDTVFTINTENLEIENEFSAGDAPSGITISNDDKTLYITNKNDDAMLFVDSTSGKILSKN